MMATKTLLYRLQENQSIFESGIQLRNNNPSILTTNKTWYNKIDEALRIYDNNLDQTNEFITKTEPSSPYGNTVFPPTADIDWSLGYIFMKTGLNGTVNLTFSNVETKTIYIALDAVGISTATINLPVGTKNSFDSSIFLDLNYGTLLKVSNIDGQILVEKIFYGELTAFPAGLDGDLIILNGETVNITAGEIKDYSSVDIQAGGTLNISGGGEITQIYCAGNCNIDGQIIGRRVSNTYSHSITTVTGEPLSYTVTQNNGGSGGNGGTPPNPTPGGMNFGGAGTNGYGGGGAGGMFAPHFANMAGAGGSGGGNSGQPPGLPAPLRGLGNITNAAGNNGGNAGPGRGKGGDGGGSGGGGGGIGFVRSPPFVSAGGGGGGGGGMKGQHGKALYLYVTGLFTGSGQILLNGTNGFNGGSGGGYTPPIGSNPSNGTTGGGGGGGAGGSGGRLWIKESVAGNFASTGITVSVGGGAGGSGGAAGFPIGTYPASGNRKGIAGAAGVAGAAGSSSITLI